MSEHMKLAWLPEGSDRRYCLFLIKEDGFKIKIKDPKYKELGYEKRTLSTLF